MRSIRWQIALVAISIVTIAGLLTGCNKEPKQAAPAPQTVPMNAGGTDNSSGLAIGHGGSGGASGMPAAGGGNAAAGVGLTWTAPSSWKTGPEKPMRAATYLIPAAGGDTDGGELAVFAAIGGGVQANIDRWIGQFSQPDGSQSASKASAAFCSESVPTVSRK